MMFSFSLFRLLSRFQKVKKLKKGALYGLDSTLYLEHSISILNFDYLFYYSPSYPPSWP